MLLFEFACPTADTVGDADDSLIAEVKCNCHMNVLFGDFTEVDREDLFNPRSGTTAKSSTGHGVVSREGLSSPWSQTELRGP
jgi:hypothetical protein